MKNLARPLLVIASIGLMGIGCSGDEGPEGTYQHPEEGTITLTEGGEGTWEQEGDDEPFAFGWESEGDAVVFSKDDEEAGRATIADGDLVLPPDMISGDDDVTFDRQ